MDIIRHFTSKKSLIWAWKMLLVFLLINYQIVVILCNDFVVFKFLRDFVLLYILGRTVFARKRISKRYWVAGSILLLFFAIAFLKTEGISVGVVCLRRYFFPLGVLIAAGFNGEINSDDYFDFIRFGFNLCAVLALWGIFQAYVLGDQFLINLGYPTIYSYAYQRITLNMSYYFGNLGIQRVTSTVSNSNVFAIVLGIILLLTYLNHGKVLKKKVDWLKLAVILFGYILTVSRSNFVALLIVAVLVVWKEIPYKKRIFQLVGICLGVFFLVFLLQDENGITHKLVNWIVDSLTFQESSAAGRTAFWSKAFDGVIANPLGIGLGKVGTAATTIGGAMDYVCENSYLAMALDLGWGGMLTYLSCLGLFATCIILNLRKSKREKIPKVALACLVYFMVVCIFSNHIYDMEAVCVVYLFVGLAFNILSDNVENGIGENERKLHGLQAFFKENRENSTKSKK